MARVTVAGASRLRQLRDGVHGAAGHRIHPQSPSLPHIHETVLVPAPAMPSASGTPFQHDHQHVITTVDRQPVMLLPRMRGTYLPLAPVSGALAP